MRLKFLLQLLQQAASHVGMESTVAVVDGGTSLANGGSGNGGRCHQLQQAQQKKNTNQLRKQPHIDGAKIDGGGCHKYA
jgi:hypothetical protein